MNKNIITKNIPLISCILPIYNGYPDLIKSINSVLEQSFESFELIIINDGSTDLTHDYVSNLQDKRIIYINKTKNENLPAALNSGLDVCKGKYITWTSHDNYYSPDAFLCFYNALETFPEIDFVYSTHQFFGNKKNKVEAIHQTILEFIFRFRGVCGFMWRKSITDKIGYFDTKLFGIEDFDYWIRILLENPIFLGINKTLYYFKVHNNSLSFKLSKQNKFLELDKQIANKLLNTYCFNNNNNLLNINTFFPYLKYCYNYKSCSYAYYILGLSLSNTTRIGFKKIFKDHIVNYFLESYRIDNTFTPSLINIILCLKMNNCNYDKYLFDLKNNVHINFSNNINLDFLLNLKINIDNLYSYLIKFNLDDSDLMIEKKKFMNYYFIDKIIFNNT